MNLYDWLKRVFEVLVLTEERVLRRLFRHMESNVEILEKGDD